MARRKKAADVYWSVADIDAIVEATLEDAEKYFGGRVFTGGEEERRIVGLPLPGLGLRYLFQSKVLPLGRVYTIAGPTGSCKSAFLYWLFRLHRAFGGRNVLFENESKDSPELRLSICNYDRNAVIVRPTDYLEEWIKGAHGVVKWADSVCVGTKERPGPGFTVPFCFGVDSLMAKMSEKLSARLAKDAADNGYSAPAEANIIKDFFRAYPKLLIDKPYTFAATNHQKVAVESPRPGLPPSKTMPGGKSVGFHSTYVIEMSPAGDIPRTADGVEGIKVRMNTLKGGLGAGRKKIDVTLKWWTEFVDGKPVQRTEWGWYSAGIQLLEKLYKDRGDQYRLIDSALELKFASGRRVWSPRFTDVPKTEPLPYAEAGRLIDELPADVLDVVHGALGVRDHAVFRPGVSFDQQVEEAGRRAPLTTPLVADALEVNDDDDDVADETAEGAE